MKEEWRVTYCSDELLVSDQGNVVLRYRAKRPVNEYITRSGFRMVYIGGGNKFGQRRPVHQLVLHAFVGPKPEGCIANFKNGIRSDCTLQNLEYVPISNTE